MRIPLDPFRLLLIWLADCLNPHLRDVINYRQEENRVRREQLGNTRLGLNDDQRRRGLHDAGDLRLQQSPAAGAYVARHIVQSRRGLLPGVQLLCRAGEPEHLYGDADTAHNRE